MARHAKKGRRRRVRPTPPGPSAVPSPPGPPSPQRHRQARSLPEGYIDRLRELFRLLRMQEARAKLTRSDQNPSLLTRWEIGQTIREWMKWKMSPRTPVRNLFTELAEALDIRLGENSLRTLANYGGLEEKEVRRHVEANLPWRKAAKKAPSKFVDLRKKMREEPEDYFGM